MTADELLAQWPGIELAVAWCELHIFNEFALPGTEDLEMENDIRKAMQEGNFTFDDFEEITRETLREEIDNPEYCGSKQPLRDALEELNHASFRQYLGFRFGMM